MWPVLWEIMRKIGGRVALPLNRRRGRKKCSLGVHEMMQRHSLFERNECGDHVERVFLHCRWCSHTDTVEIDY